MATSVTIREPSAGYSTYPRGATSAREPAGLAARSSADRFTRLGLVAANSGILLYVTAALGLAV